MTQIMLTPEEFEKSEYAKTPQPNVHIKKMYLDGKLYKVLITKTENDCGCGKTHINR